MLVKDLIERLLNEDPEAKVVISGYEYGHQLVKRIITGCIKRDEESSWYSGDYNFTSDVGDKFQHFNEIDYYPDERDSNSAVYIG